MQHCSIPLQLETSVASFYINKSATTYDVYEVRYYPQESRYFEKAIFLSSTLTVDVHA